MSFSIDWNQKGWSWKGRNPLAFSSNCASGRLIDGHVGYNHFKLSCWDFDPLRISRWTSRTDEDFRHCSGWSYLCPSHASRCTWWIGTASKLISSIKSSTTTRHHTMRRSGISTWRRCWISTSMTSTISTTIYGSCLGYRWAGEHCLASLWRCLIRVRKRRAPNEVVLHFRKGMLLGVWWGDSHRASCTFSKVRHTCVVVANQAVLLPP